MQMEYKVYTPPDALRPYVDSLWSSSTSGDADRETPPQCCLPLGMSEFIVQVKGTDSRNLLSGRWRYSPRVYFLGVMTQPVTWTMRGGALMVGARLKPEGMVRLFHTPLATFQNQETDAMPFLDREERGMLDEILRAVDTDEAIARLVRMLEGQLERMPEVEDRFLKALARVRAQRRSWDKDAMNDALCVSDRQMQRMFKTHLGLSPKTYFRIMRFREAYDTTIARREVDWIDLSCTLGYSDQAHFIRDFKRYTGITPGAFQRVRSTGYSFTARA